MLFIWQSIMKNAGAIHFQKFQSQNYQSLYQSPESAFQAKIQIQNSIVDTTEKPSTEHEIRNSEAESSIETQDQAKLQTANTEITTSRIQQSNSTPQHQLLASKQQFHIKYFRTHQKPCHPSLQLIIRNNHGQGKNGQNIINFKNQ